MELANKYVSKHNIFSNAKTARKVLSKKQDVPVVSSSSNSSDHLKLEYAPDGLGDPRTHIARWYQLANSFLDKSQPVKRLFETSQRMLEDPNYPRQLSHGVLMDISRVAARFGLASILRHHSEDTQPCTIEFRQHGCTLDAEEIEHWIKFLFALVWLAERRTAQTYPFHSSVSSTGPENEDEPAQPSDSLDSPFTTPSIAFEANKYSGPISDVATLCGLDNLDLPYSEILYWVTRAERYEADHIIHFEKTRARRKRRRQDKARLGIKLADTEMLASNKDDSPVPKDVYEVLGRVQLLGHLCEKLGISKSSRRASGSEKAKFAKLSRMSKSAMVAMAVTADRNLRQEGLYVKYGEADEIGLPRVRD